MPSGDQTIATALEYLSRGWSVFPVKGKKPLLSSWHPYQERLPEVEEIRRWWTKWPDAGIAIVTGKISNLVVVDIDPDKGGTREGIEATGRITVTGRKGWHYYYSYPKDADRVSNRVEARPGVDVRGDGGYVIAAPSVHENGNSYAWESQDDLASMPAWVSAPSPVSELAHDPNERPWVSDMLGGNIPEGQRNDTVARYAGYLCSKGMALEIAQAHAVLTSNGWDNPLPESEVRRTVASVYQTAKRNEDRNTEEEKKKLAQPFRALRFHEYLEEYGAYEQQWLADKWMLENTIAFVASPPGGYKTWITFDLAVSVASGKPFLDVVPVNVSGPVIIIQQEDFAGQIAERLALIAEAKYGIPPITKDTPMFAWPEPVPDLPIYIHPDAELRIDDQIVMSRLENLIKEVRPKMMIIDPLYFAVSMDNHMADAVKDLKVFKRLRDEYGCTFVFVHHTNKSGAESFDRQAMWGSQFLNAFLETGIHTRGLADEPGAVVVHRHFKGTGAVEKVRLDFDISTEPGEFRYKVTQNKASDDDVNLAGAPAGTSARQQQILTALMDGPAKAGALMERTGIAKTAFYSHMSKLEEQGRVLKNGSSYHLPEKVTP